MKSFIETLFNTNDPTAFDLSTLEHAIAVIRGVIVGIGALWSLIGIFIAGYWYFTAYGNEARANKAKTTLMYVVLGAVIMILSQVIIYEIGKRLYNTNPPDVEKAIKPFQ